MQIKEAVQTASKRLPEVFPSAGEQDLRLEGVEKTDDERFWKITFSYSSPTAKAAGFEFQPREYKTVRLRDSDGEFMGARNGMMLDAL